MESQELNQTNPTTNQNTSIEPHPTSQQEPAISKQADKWIVPSLLVVILLLLGSTGFFAYNYFQLRSQKNTQGNQIVETNQASPIISPSIENNDVGWKTFSDSNIGIEFSYPSLHRADLGKLGSYNFITELSQDGWDISLVNNYGPTISIFNNPDKLSLEEIFDKRSQYHIETFAEDEKMMVDGMEAKLRYEIWDFPDEIIVIHFVRDDKYYQISIFASPDEDLSKAKKRLLRIMDTLRFTELLST